MWPYTSDSFAFLLSSLVSVSFFLYVWEPVGRHWLKGEKGDCYYRCPCDHLEQWICSYITWTETGLYATVRSFWTVWLSWLSPSIANLMVRLFSFSVHDSWRVHRRQEFNKDFVSLDIDSTPHLYTLRKLAIRVSIWLVCIFQVKHINTWISVGWVVWGFSRSGDKHGSINYRVDYTYNLGKLD